jgi:hypothetical protein
MIRSIGAVFTPVIAKAQSRTVPCFTGTGGGDVFEPSKPLQYSTSQISSAEVIGFNNLICKLGQNNLEGLEFTKNLPLKRRKELFDGLNAQNAIQDFLWLATENKSGLLTSTDVVKIVEPAVNSEKYDVVHDDDGCSYIFNKQMVKNIINQNREIYTRKLNLPLNTDVDEIYSRFISSDGPLKIKDGITPGDRVSNVNDIVGLALGYPKYSSIIFQLENKSGAGQLKEFRPVNGFNMPEINVDLDIYKSTLKNYLYSENSIYKDYSGEFKRDVSNKIDKIEKLQFSSCVTNETADWIGQQFLYVGGDDASIDAIRSGFRDMCEKLSRNT